MVDIQINGFWLILQYIIILLGEIRCYQQPEGIFHQLSFCITFHVSISRLSADLYLSISSPCRPVSHWSISNSSFEADLLHKITDNEAGFAVTIGGFIPPSAGPDVQVHTPPDFPIVIQMLGWWLKCLSPLIGACRGITAEGEHVAPAALIWRNHICELTNNIIYREVNSR